MKTRQDEVRDVSAMLDTNVDAGYCEICGEHFHPGDEIGEFAMPNDGSGPCWNCGANPMEHADWCFVPKGEIGHEHKIAHAQCGIDAGATIA